MYFFIKPRKVTKLSKKSNKKLRITQNESRNIIKKKI